MCTIINIKEGAMALLGDYSQYNFSIQNLAHTINLYVQYGNHAIQPIQIQIDQHQWASCNDESYYINLLREHEVTATLYDANKKLILSWQ